MAMAIKWYYKSGASVVGPISTAGLRRLIVGGKIGRQTYLRRGRDGDWVAAAEVEGLFDRADLAEASASPPKLPQWTDQASSGPAGVDSSPARRTSSRVPRARSPWLGGLLFAGPVLVVLLVVVVRINWPTETGEPAPPPEPTEVAEDYGGDQPKMPVATAPGDGSRPAEEPPAENVQEPEPPDSPQDEPPDVATPGGAADQQPRGSVDLRADDTPDRQPGAAEVEPPETLVVGEPADIAGEEPEATSGGEPEPTSHERPDVAPAADQDDKRLAEFRRIHQQVVAMFDDWKTQRDEQRKLEELLEPARADCARLERQEAFIEGGIRSLNRELATARRHGDQDAIDVLLTVIENKQRELAVIYVFRGRSYVAQQRYLQAAGDFRMAVQLAEEAPETHEAYASLLATCPHQTVRNGRKAIEHATTACELTQWKSWFCLDTLAAAYAEAGDFEAALTYAGQALNLAPTESQLGVRQKMSLYQAGKPSRMR